MCVTDPEPDMAPGDLSRRALESPLLVDILHQEEQRQQFVSFFICQILLPWGKLPTKFLVALPRPPHPVSGEARALQQVLGLRTAHQGHSSSHEEEHSGGPAKNQPSHQGEHATTSIRRWALGTESDCMTAGISGVNHH